MKRIGLLLVAVLLFAGVQAAKEIAPKTDSIQVETTVQLQGECKSANDSMLMTKLSPEQLMVLEQEKLRVERMRIEAGGVPKMPMGSAAIVLICLLPFLFTGIVVFLGVRHKNEVSKRRYDLYMKSLEMGQSIPEHFFDEPKKENPSSNLKKGIICSAVGLALVIYFMMMNNTHALIAGIIPLFVGIGFLLVHFLEKPKTNTADQNNEQHG